MKIFKAQPQAKFICGMPEMKYLNQYFKIHTHTHTALEAIKKDAFKPKLQANSD